MLFSRANTEELVGATAIVEKTDGKTLLPDKLWRFVWAKPVEPVYMRALFQSLGVRRELGKLSSGTSASMRNISQGKLFDLRLPVAPIHEQKAFSEHVLTVQSILSQQSNAAAKAQAVFDALLARSFVQPVAV
jgi:type I restriction enzyme S subunit